MGKAQRCTTNRLLPEYPMGKRIDRISALNDEILITILSLLTLKEATRTCVLSHRWKDLWTFTTGAWTFCDTEMNVFQLRRSVTSKIMFVNWVSKVLHQHKSSHLDAVRIRCALGSYSSAHIDKWVQLAMEKSIHIMELNLSGIPWTHQYEFPSVQKLMDMSEMPHRISFSNLRSLTFKYVDVSNNILQYVLSTCHLLEHLCIVGSLSLVDSVRITSESKALKFVEIADCWLLKKIEIFAPNLRAFAYAGKKMCTSFLVVPPSFKALNVGHPSADLFVCEIEKHLDYVSQLETLVVAVTYEAILRRIDSFPKLTSLKRLELTIEEGTYQSLLCFADLVDMAPMLSHLRIEFMVSGKEYSAHLLECTYPCYFLPRLRWHALDRRPPVQANQSLTHMEFVEFCGFGNQKELVQHLLKIAVSLKTLTVKIKETPWCNPRFCANQLRGSLPPGANLVVHS